MSPQKPKEAPTIASPGISCVFPYKPQWILRKLNNKLGGDFRLKVSIIFYQD